MGGPERFTVLEMSTVGLGELLGTSGTRVAVNGTGGADETGTAYAGGGLNGGAELIVGVGRSGSIAWLHPGQYFNPWTLQPQLEQKLGIFLIFKIGRAVRYATV